MIHLFEDSPDTPLSVLYQHAYRGTGTTLMYAEGATKLIDCLCELPDEKVAVYVDVIPDNENTVFTYNRLVAYAQGHIGRIFVIPTFSAEYYFIKSIAELLNMWLPEGEVARCLSVRDWGKSSILETEDDFKFARTFEKFCKLILIKSAPDCMKITGVAKCGASGNFYTSDCSWDGCELGYTKSLEEKALQYVRKYPIFPSLVGKYANLCNVNNEQVVLANHLLCEVHTALRSMFVPNMDKALAMLRLYSLSPEEYKREYRRYGLENFRGSIPPIDLKKGF